MTSDLAQDAGIPVNLKGVYVERITQNGPADKAGIHGITTDKYLKKHLGDVIRAVDGHNITKSDDLINYIGQHKIAGNNLTLTVYRNGHAIDLKATLSLGRQDFHFLPHDQSYLQSSILQLDIRQPHKEQKYSSISAQ